MAEKYDIAIIGAGPGGYIAAIRAGQLGLRTVVVEREKALGGVCLNWGCIPTKALIKNAQMVRFLEERAEDFGISVTDPSASWQKAIERSRRVVKRMNRGVEGLLRKNGVDVVQGTARISSATSLEVTPPEGDKISIQASNIIVATGSRSRLLPGLVADGARVMTSRHAVTLEDAPSRLVIIGAGAVGMEFAYVYNAYGTEVTVVEMLDRVLPLEDQEAGELVAKHFAKSGIDIRLSTPVQSVDIHEGGVKVTLGGGKDGQTDVVEADKVLVAIGRMPNTEGLDLEAAGVAVSERGWIQVDDHLRTSAPTIFAIGDVAGPPMLAHKASHEGVQVVEMLAGLEVHPVDASFIPNCTYCEPQVASIGHSEAAARSAGYDVKVSKFPFIAIGKSIAIGEHDGWVKIVADAKYGEILGATIVGPDATEIIHELVLARSAELTVDDVAASIHAHPTLSEAIHEAALGITGVPLHI